MLVLRPKTRFHTLLTDYIQKENTYIARKRLFECHVDDVDPYSLLSSVAHAEVEPFEILGLRV